MGTVQVSKVTVDVRASALLMEFASAYADDPARFVTGETAQVAFRESVDRYAARLWGIIEEETVGAWFLGERFSALDIYIAAMTRWRTSTTSSRV